MFENSSKKSFPLIQVLFLGFYKGDVKVTKKKKKVNQSNDPIVKLVMTVSHVLVDNDFRIRKKENRKLFRSALKETVAKGFIRTHAFVNNWLLDLFELGEISPATFHDIMKEMPWSWDKTREYIDSLEEIDIVQYSRDSRGRKTCTLVMDGKHKVRQVENLICYYKKSEEHSQMSFIDVRRDYLDYYGKLSEWFSKKTETEKMALKVTQAASNKTDKFIWDLVKIIGKAKKKGLETDLLQFLKENPLLIYSLERVG